MKPRRRRALHIIALALWVFGVALLVSTGTSWADHGPEGPDQFEEEEESTPDPDATVCRNGATITIPTSQVLGTDTSGDCPAPDPEISVDVTPEGEDVVPGGEEADPGVDFDRPVDALAVGGNSDDPAAAGPEETIGAADAPAGDDVVTVGAGTELPYTGAETNIALGLGFLAFLLGSVAFAHAGRVTKRREFGAAT